MMVISVFSKVVPLVMYNLSALVKFMVCGRFGHAGLHVCIMCSAAIHID